MSARALGNPDTLFSCGGDGPSECERGERAGRLLRSEETRRLPVPVLTGAAAGEGDERVYEVVCGWEVGKARIVPVDELKLLRDEL